MILVGAGLAKRKGVGVAGLDIATIWTILAVGLNYGVCSGVVICPGDCRAFLNRDAGRAKSEVLDTHFIGGGRCFTAFV